LFEAAWTFPSGFLLRRIGLSFRRKLGSFFGKLRVTFDQSFLFLTPPPNPQPQTPSTPPLPKTLNPRPQQIFSYLFACSIFRFLSSSERMCFWWGWFIWFFSRCLILNLAPAAFALSAPPSFFSKKTCHFLISLIFLLPSFFIPRPPFIVIPLRKYSSSRRPFPQTNSHPIIYLIPLFPYRLSPWTS